MARQTDRERARFSSLMLMPSLQRVQIWVLWGLRLAPGLLVFTAALIAPPLRRPDGWLHPLAWTLAVGGISLTLVGAAWRTRWQQCAGLLALALIGQAAGLQLVLSPPYGVYQRFLPWREVLTSPNVATVLQSHNRIGTCDYRTARSTIHCKEYAPGWHSPTAII